MEPLIDYSHYLALKGQNIGLTTFDGHILSPKETDLNDEIKRVCRQVILKLQSCKSEDIADLTDSYSTLYMIGFRSLPDPSFVERQRNRLFDYWKSGDKTIEESQIYGMMMNTTTILPKSQIEAFKDIQGRWIEILNAHNSFPDVDTYERYQRLALLMRDRNISCLNGNAKSAKKKWYEQNKIANFATVGSKILKSYRLFITSLFPDVMTSSRMMTQDNEVLRELVGRKDLNLYERDTFKLALAYNQRFIKSSAS